MLLDTFALSISGRRSNNEDAICARPELGLFVVADGMGGYEGGEIASAIAVDAICELVRRTSSDVDVTWPYKIDPARTIDENEILVATRLANDRIAARREGVLEQMGSTVAVLRIADQRAVIGHVGDSRIYRLRAGTLMQLTIDHSLLAQLIAAGTPPPDPETFPWRHVVTRALGTSTGEPEVQLDRALPGDVFLVCSDGLSEVLAPERIAGLLTARAEQACRGDVPLEILQAIVGGSERRLDGLEPDLRAILDVAMEQDARNRFGSIEELRCALESVRRTREPVGAAELAA